MVALTGNFHVVTSSGTTNISAVLFFISHIAKARYVRTFFEFRAGHTMLCAFHFHKLVQRNPLSEIRKSLKADLGVVIHECTLFAIAERSARRWN